MSNWKQYFEQKILDRGYNYFLSNLISQYDNDGETITAVVEGTESYDVEIELENNSPVDMYCSCPYASDGECCKHMAAVLYFWDSTNHNTTVYQSSKNEISIEEMVNNANETDVKNFLIVLLKNNKNLALKFMNLTQTTNSDNTINNYKKSVDKAIGNHLGRNGFIDYYEADAFIDDLMSFTDDIQIMINAGNYMNAFELSYYICAKTENIDIDDSDGQITYLYDSMSEYWKNIADTADDETKSLLFKKVLKILNEHYSEYDYLNDYMKSFLFSEFNEKKYIPDILSFIDSKIEEMNNDSYHYSYTKESLLLRRLRIMYNNEYSFEEILDYCKKNWTCTGIRKWLANVYEERKEYEKAISIYEEILTLEKEHQGNIYDYKISLKELYRNTGDREKYIKILWELVGKRNNLKLYRELKACYTESEWIQKREDVFSAVSGYTCAEFFREEKLYDRLREYIADWPFEQYREFSDTLGKIYPDDVLDKYEDSLNNMALSTANRKTYQGWVSILKSMDRFDGGHERAAKIINEWKIKYKRRSALIDELKKLQ